MEPEELENKSEKIFDGSMRWTYRSSGVGAVLGALWGFLSTSDGLIDRLLSSVTFGVGFAFIILILGSLVAIILKLAVSSFGTDENPFKQGLQFAFVLFLLASFIDGALLGGTFLVDPLIITLAGGDWESTYYGCPTEWVVVDEGSYCDDAR